MLIKNIILLRAHSKFASFIKVILHLGWQWTFWKRCFRIRFSSNKQKTCFHAKSSISPILCSSFNEVQQHIVSETFEFGLLIDFQINIILSWMTILHYKSFSFEQKLLKTFFHGYPMPLIPKTICSCKILNWSRMKEEEVTMAWRGASLLRRLRVSNFH